jgi:hypothetical protein
MDAPRRTDPRARDPRTASADAAGRLALAAARRAQLDHVRAAVRLRLAAIQRQRQELAGRRKPRAGGGR